MPRPQGKMTGDEGQIRQTTFSLSAQQRRESYRLEDKRWEPRSQRVDWVVLAVFILLDLSWAMLVFYFEPGLRDPGIGAPSESVVLKNVPTGPTPAPVVLPTVTVPPLRTATP